MELLLLQTELEQADRWLTSYQHTLSSQEYGDSVSDVAELLKNQEDLEVLILTQQDRFSSLKTLSQRERRLANRGNHGNRDGGGAERRLPV
ncbi:hypothetical protein CRUP_037944, partial [Coryphaenoides rupestris]